MKQNEHKTSDLGFFPACLSKVLEPPPVRSAAQRAAAGQLSRTGGATDVSKSAKP